MPEGTLPAVNRPVRFNGLFRRGGGHGPAGDGGPGIVVEPEAGVQAIADSQGVIECEGKKCSWDVTGHVVEHDSDLLGHVVEVITGTKRIDGIVRQGM